MASDMFYCYSKNLCHFLKMNGINYHEKKQHDNGIFYYTFSRTKQLGDALNRWEQYKKLFPKVR